MAFQEYSQCKFFLYVAILTDPHQRFYTSTSFSLVMVALTPVHNLLLLIYKVLRSEREIDVTAATEILGLD